MNVCNATEDIMVRRQITNSEGAGDALPLLQGASVHSPSQCLPQANAQTTMDRWARWTAFSCMTTGSKLDPLRKLDSALSAQDCWKLMMVSKDNLALNHNTLGCYEAEVDKRLQSGTDENSSVSTLLHINCHGRAGVLCTKEVTSRADDLRSKLVP